MTPQTLYSFRPWGGAFLNCFWDAFCASYPVYHEYTDRKSRSEISIHDRRHLVNVCVCLSVQCNSQIPHVCAAATCGRRFWSSSCTGISSRLSGFAGELGGWTGLRMHDCSGGMKRVSHLYASECVPAATKVWRKLSHTFCKRTAACVSLCASLGPLDSRIPSRSTCS